MKYMLLIPLIALACQDRGPYLVPEADVTWYGVEEDYPSKPADDCGEEEIFGDGIDQDCDGSDGLAFTNVVLPPGTDPMGWQWRDDLLAMGGPMRVETGRMVGHTLYFEEGITGEPSHQIRTAYGYLPEVIGEPRRLWLDQGPLDLILTSDGDTRELQVWSDIGLIYTDHRETEATAVDGAVAGHALYAVTCGGGELRYRQVDLWTGTVTVEDQLESEADRCALFAHGGQIRVITGVSAGGLLEKYDLSEIGFEAWMPVYSHEIPVEQIASASADGEAFWGIVMEGRVLAFSSTGYAGWVLGEGDALTDLTLSSDGAGGVAAAWSDASGDVTLVGGRWGAELSGTRMQTAGAPEAVNVGISSRGIAVAAWEAGSVQLGRALRPQP